jgi:uncharacterized membrane protein YccC
MELRSMLPLVVAALVVFVLVRLVLGAIKSSAKLMVWAIVAAAVFGLAYLWYQGPSATGESLPTLSIPAVERPATN